ncbi:MSC_0623 family F1-like ATPase-associated protein [Mycoplasma sp. B6188]|uniref:MSC_0623 family F1-like ATPase-associated protein n=1 Tax=Mycoplasma sp. B6188 TaxID=3401673 RepID=UPI003AAB70F0
MKLNFLSNLKNNKAAQALLDQQQAYLKQIYSTYNQVKTESNFISYQVFTNQFLILNNIQKHGGLWEELINERDEFMAHKNQIAYRDFFISWSINPRFSQNILVPVISHQFDSNTKVLSWAQAENDDIAAILTKYNDYLAQYLVSNDCAVEIIPDIIVKYNFDLKDYNLYFSPELISNAHKEN